MSCTDTLDLPDAMAQALQSAYATAPRVYHDFAHIQQVLQWHCEVAAGPGWYQPRETTLAVLYHDAVYQPGRDDNESRSAALVCAHIQRWLPQAALDARRVAELILLTARHGQLMPDDYGRGRQADDTRHFLDCDMAILGASTAVFERYDRGITEEYAGVVPSALFRQRRRKFLRALLDRERIFLSEYFHVRLDASARANIARAIRGMEE